MVAVQSSRGHSIAIDSRKSYEIAKDRTKYRTRRDPCFGRGDSGGFVRDPFFQLSDPDRDELIEQRMRPQG